MSVERVGEFALACAYLEPDARREQRLRVAAAALTDWDEALIALEAHGVLGLAERNLTRAGIRPPVEAAARLAARAEAMRTLERAFELTLARFAAAARTRNVELILLKGAALLGTLYPEPGLRAQGDLDVLIRPRAFSAALAAAREVGLFPAPRALPSWWYRLAHFHHKLVPADPWQRELELHWHLHPLVQLYTVRLEDLLRRRVPITRLGHALFVLDPLDQFLHLVTHLARHVARDALDAETLRAWAASPRSPLRLKWLVDLSSAIDRSWPPVAALVTRAAEWNAEADLALVLGWLTEHVLLSGPSAAWVGEVRTHLPVRGTAARSAPRDSALEGFDFRASALRAIPRWVWPPAEHFGRRSESGTRAVAGRGAHALLVSARLALLALATPLALAQRTLRSRRAERLSPQASQTLLEQARARGLPTVSPAAT